MPRLAAWLAALSAIGIGLVLLGAEAFVVGTRAALFPQQQPGFDLLQVVAGGGGVVLGAAGMALLARGRPSPPLGREGRDERGPRYGPPQSGTPEQR